MSITDTRIGYILNSARARLIPHPIGAPVLAPVPAPVLAPALATVLTTVPVLATAPVPVLTTARDQPGRRAPLPGPLPPGSGPH